MKYISVSPDQIYFHWQIEVFIQNFLEVGINGNKIEVILLYDDRPSAKGLEIQKKYPFVRFFFYKDDRKDKSYIPAKKPYGMYKHLLEYPDLNDEPIFYHDADIIFIKKIHEQPLESGDAWYLSDCDSYIGYKYVVSKGYDQFVGMCDIVGIPANYVKFNEGGGAQYVVKKTTASYWLKVYEDSNKLYKYLAERNKGIPECIQVWTAEMWATLWVAWQFGFITKIHDELKFIFATNAYDDVSKCKILHNAGVTQRNSKEMFFKGDYSNGYPKNDLKYEDKFASYYYYEQVKKHLWH